MQSFVKRVDLVLKSIKETVSFASVNSVFYRGRLFTMVFGHMQSFLLLLDVEIEFL